MGHLSVITPVERGREASLRRTIEAFPRDQSPFAKLPTTHFARLVPIPQLVYEGHGQRPDVLRSEYLLFTSDFDGPREAYLEDLCAHMADEAHAVWSHCVGYPGSAEPPGFPRYLRDNEVPAGFSVVAYPDDSVDQVRRSLALREGLVELARRAGGMDAEALQRAWLDLAS